MRYSKFIISILCCIAMSGISALPTMAQRVVTPVESSDLPMEILAKQAEKARQDTIVVDTITKQEPIH